MIKINVMRLGRVLPLLTLFFFSVQAFSQDTTGPSKPAGHAIRGRVGDTENAAKMGNASIVLLRAQDSMLVKFTYADAAGAFVFNNVSPGRYVVLISYPKYGDYVDLVSLDSANMQHDFGLVKLTPKSKLLEEVIVQGRISTVKLKGDTTEYNVKNYKVQPNAKVEDLLRQLPGIQVDREGRITAQGQAVNRVLVDGEEFFGDDPTLVTKNIRADMVDKVQVYDKKSDQALLTGIDDGQKEKTINLKIKEDKKNGYFGKLEAGVGTDGFYLGQGMFNSFKGKRKFSVYGIAGNDGKTGLGWMDNARYASSTVEMTDPGVIVDLGGGDELETFDGRYNGQGIPTVRAGGVHYDNKWDKDRQGINLNYKIGSLGVDGVSSLLTQNNLPGAVINKNSEQTFNNYMLRNKVDGAYQLRLDSSSEMKLYVDGMMRKSEADNRFTSFSTDGENRLLNRESRTINNDGDQEILNARLHYQKKFRKPGRSLSANLIGASNDNEITGFLDSRISFYNNLGVVDSTQLIDQFKINNTRSTELHANAAWSEAFSPSFAVIVNYGLGTNNVNSDRSTFNKSGNKYDQLDSLFSNRYEIDQFYNQVGAFFNYSKGKSLLNFGTKVNAVNFKQTNQYTQGVLNRNFTNWFPQVNWQYQFSERAMTKLSYSGTTTMPTVDELQPVLVNSDPLNIILGNQNLRPSFTNQVFAMFQNFNPLNNQLLGVFFKYNSTSDAIVRSVFTEANGRSINQAINLGDENQAGMNISAFFDSKIKALKMDAGVNVAIDRNKMYAFANGTLNKLTFNSYSLQVRGNKVVPEKFDLNFAFGPTYTQSGSSLQPEVDNNAAGFNGNLGFTVFLPAKFQLSSNINYQYLGKTAVFNEDLSRAIINASLSRTFLKAQNLKLSLSGNDLLNQNIGFNRNVSGFLLVQNSFTTIRRYFMLSLSYDFNKTGGKTE
jgi:hypothetical protein